MLESALHKKIEIAMAGAVPQSKNQSLVDRLNSMAKKRMETGKYDQWEWQVLKRDVESFAKKSEFEDKGLLLLAVVWGMAANSVEMDKCLNRYAGKFGKDWAWHRARAQQGPSFGRLNAVVDMLKFGSPKGDIPNLLFVAKVCNQSGLFQTTAETLEEAYQLGAALPEEEIKHYAHLPAILKYMDENSVDEIMMAERIACASKVVLDLAGTLTSFEAYGSDAGITFEYTVDAEIDRLIDIDFAISQALVDSFEDTYSVHLSIGVIPPARFQ